MLFKVQYIITRFIKKLICRHGVEPAAYVLNYNISVVLPYFITLT